MQGGKSNFPVPTPNGSSSSSASLHFPTSQPRRVICQNFAAPANADALS